MTQNLRTIFWVQPPGVNAFAAEVHINDVYAEPSTPGNYKTNDPNYSLDDPCVSNAYRVLFLSHLS
jgi:hypothetical protein